MLHMNYNLSSSTVIVDGDFEKKKMKRSMTKKLQRNEINLLQIDKNTSIYIGMKRKK